MTIQTVGLVGAGVMGRGLAETVARSGLDVVLIDVDRAVLDEAKERVTRSMKSAALFDRKLREGLTETLARIQASTDFKSLAATDFVIESTTENWSIKKDVYKKLAQVCRPGCVMAANTSVIPIAKIAAQTEDPTAVLGMHFMNPVPQKPVVEVIRSDMTSDATIATACGLLERLGKRGIIVNDNPGFVTNRVLMLTINEAVAVVEEGVAGPEEVDEIFVSCFSHAMGPLATADLIGLDTILLSLNELQAHLQNDKFCACDLLRDKVARGDLGRKTGRGFFDYNKRSSSK